jgi:choline kinase
MESAVILASGLSHRLRHLTGGRSKCTIKIRGYPLIMYPIRTLSLLDIEKLYIVVSKIHLKHMERYLKRYTLGDYEIIYIPNPRPDKENGYSLLLALEHIEAERFILSVSDHIYTHNIVKKLLEDYKPTIDILVGGDSQPRYINIDEATKIMADKSMRILEIGKRLERYTHIDIGLFIMKRRALKDLIHLKERDRLPLSELITSLIRLEREVYVSDIRGRYWTDIDTAKDIYEILYGQRKRVIEEVLHEMVHNG